MRVLFSIAAFALFLPFAAAQPKFDPGVSKADLLRMEEEVELLQAQVATRKAYIKAAIAELEGAKPIAELAIQALERGTGSAGDASRAKSDLARTEALLEIRECELREVEVKLKFARQRLENAKARKGARPAPPPPPLAADPANPGAKAKLLELQAAKAELMAARAEAERAKRELQRVQAFEKRDAVGKDVVEAAEVGYLKTQAAVRKAEAQVVAAQAAFDQEKANPKK